MSPTRCGWRALAEILDTRGRIGRGRGQCGPVGERAHPRNANSGVRQILVATVLIGVRTLRALAIVPVARFVLDGIRPDGGGQKRERILLIGRGARHPARVVGVQAQQRAGLRAGYRVSDVATPRPRRPGGRKSFQALAAPHRTEPRHNKAMRPRQRGHARPWCTRRSMCRSEASPRNC